MNKYITTPLLALAACLLVLTACTNDSELPASDTLSPPVIITANSSWIDGIDTRATMKEEFNLDDEITLTYDDVAYTYILTTTGWQPTGDALRIPLSVPEPFVTATCQDTKGYTLAATGTPYITTTAAGQKAWGISLAFRYSNAGMVDLTLLDSSLEKIDSEVIGVIITMGTKTYTHTGPNGILLPAGDIIKVEALTEGNVYYVAYLAGNNTVVAGNRHPLVVVVEENPL
ncbi:hypothetical protein LJC35_07505 [Parabacteroides sp. OttesenSCG-928-N08]|nr:hypothetical protein [Parabacteroides sp. OttesenSCG-928-N08]